MKIVLVLGIHRSGTSLLAAGLKAIGCDLGEFGDTPDIDNPRGYFEHIEVRRFNDRLLSHLGASWDNWGFYAPTEGLDGPRFAEWRAEAAGLLTRLYKGSGIWAIKDPRITTLLPFWETVLAQGGHDFRRVLILRPPDEVAESQTRRADRRPNSFPVISNPSSMYALWAVNMHCALVSLGDDHTLLLDHSDLYDKPLETLRACADFLGLVPDHTCLDSFASEFILPAYRRVERSVQDECPAVDPWAGFARRIYESLVTRPTPRLLSLTEARTIAAAQIDLIAQLPMLLPVRQSIDRVLSALATEAKTRKDHVDLLRGIIWPLSGLVQWLPSDERLFGLRDKLVALVAGIPFDLPTQILCVRLDLRLGNLNDAERRLVDLRAAFPDHPLPKQLLSDLSRKRQERSNKSGA